LPLSLGVARCIATAEYQGVTDESLKRTARICKAEDFALLVAKAKAFKRGDFLIRCLNNEQGYARLGMVVSKKTAKHAVMRNRIKRTIRESFRKHHQELPSKDYVVSYRGAQKPPDFAMLREALIGFWQQEVIYYR